MSYIRRLNFFMRLIYKCGFMFLRTFHKNKNFS